MLQEMKKPAGGPGFGENCGEREKPQKNHEANCQKCHEKISVLNKDILFKPLDRISNRTFLESLVGVLTEDTCIPVARIQNISGGWPADPWTHGQDFALREGWNGYYCLGSHKRGNPQPRTKTSARALHIVMCDDIGTKVERDKIRLNPTYEIETSPGNYQFGFLLAEPLYDMGLAEHIGKAISNAGLSDPGAGGLPTRYARLPQGWNSKHNPPFKCQLRAFNPELTYTVLELVDGLGLELDPPNAERKNEPKQTGPSLSTPYGLKALEAECLAVTREPEGGRNHRLNQAAFAVGQLVAGQDLREDEVRLALKRAALACGLGVIEAARTIQSGMAAGMAAPRNANSATANMFEAVSDADRKENTSKPRLRALRRDDLMVAPDIDWTIKGVMPARGVGVVFGPSTVGKSFLEVDKAAAVAEGRDWFGCRVKQRPVIYAALEGQHGFKRRVMAWETHHGRCYPNNVVFAPDSIDLRSDQDTAALIELAMREAGPGAVVIVDTLNRAAPGMEENGSVDYGLILASAARIEQAVEGFVCFVGHPGKDASKGLRGHYSMFAGLDMVLEVEEVNKSELSFAWVIRKAKDGQDGVKKHFRREVIELFEDIDGDPVSSCVIVPDPEKDGTAKTWTAKLSRTNQERFEAFRLAAMESGSLDDNGAFIGLDKEAWREFFYSNSQRKTPDATRVAFSDTIRELKRGGLIYEKADGLFQFDGPGAKQHSEIICHALKEWTVLCDFDDDDDRRDRSEAKKTEESSCAKDRRAKRSEETPLGVFAPSHESGHFPVDLENKPEPSPPGTEKFDPEQNGMWLDEKIHVPEDCAGYPQLCSKCIYQLDGNCDALVAPF